MNRWWCLNDEENCIHDRCWKLWLEELMNEDQEDEDDGED